MERILSIDVVAHAVLLLPLLGFVVLALFGEMLKRDHEEDGAGRLACGVAVLAFAGSLGVAGSLARASLLAYQDARVQQAAVEAELRVPLPPPPPPDLRVMVAREAYLIDVASLQVRLALLLDPLSVVMMLVVTGIGALIHIYSLGYMAKDPERVSYFAYLNLFTFFMLLLVTAQSLALMFVGWEGVGLCSYLLIGFWFKKRSAAEAGKKAFIVNRIGDAGLILGIALAFATFGTIDIVRILDGVEALPASGGGGALTAIALLLFLGACGKSAQIPLHVWLPDAMEGPTPVSALIHAATMVTAGVYMVARLGPLYSRSTVALGVIAVVGTLTALMGASVALVQTDIKKVLAYSTVSQLGYMFLACGVGAFGVAIFHLFTHAFFKALLFLGAGSVIHALSGEQDLRKMGGLRSRIPWTFGTFLIGTLAIAGVPPLAGFFSKDAILSAAWAQGRGLLFTVGLLTAMLTAFYMWRLMCLVFFGAPREAPVEGERAVHESPWSMRVPLVVLAVGAAVVGFVPVTELVSPVLGVHTELPHPTWIPWLATLAALAGILGAAYAYLLYPEWPARIARRFSGLRRALEAKWGFDDAYGAFAQRVVVDGSTRVLSRRVDASYIDGTVNGTAAAIAGIAEASRAVQSGLVRFYLLMILGGAVLLAGYLLFPSFLRLLPVRLLSDHLLSLLIGLPAAGALAVALLPRAKAREQKIAALAVSSAVFLLSLSLLIGFIPSSEMQLTEQARWLPAYGISYHVGVDGLSLFLILLTTLLTPLALLGSWEGITQRVREFSVLMLLLESAMLGVFASLNLFLFYVFWEAMLVPMYFLIGIWGHERRVYAAAKFFLFTLAGGVLMLVGVIVLHQASGTGSFDIAVLSRARLAPGLEAWLFAAFALAFAVKVPMFPLHTWLPDAHVEAPTAGSVLLAAVLLKMGAYGFLRLAIPLFPHAFADFAPVIGLLAVAGIVYGALVSLVQTDMKKLVAYSSVSHLGFVMLGIASLTTISTVGAVYQMLSHGITTGGLFFLVGMLYERRHTRELSEFGGLKAVMPWFAAVMLLISLSSMGLPGLSGFIGELLILVGSWPSHPVLTSLAVLGVILAAAYLLLLVQRILHGEVTRESNAHLPDLSAREWCVLAPLAALAIVMGVASPLITRTIEPTIRKIVTDARAASAERAERPTDALEQAAVLDASGRAARVARGSRAFGAATGGDAR